MVWRSRFRAGRGGTGPLTYVQHLTDFRGIFAEVLAKLYGASTADLNAIIPGSAAVTQLNFLV